MDNSGMTPIRILSEREVSAAAEILRSGGLLGLPTETVYGLAANAGDATAVARIYSVKGRPNDHPVIVHIADTATLDEWAQEIPTFARALAKEFWPGPMTLVLKRKSHVGNFLTGGQDTVGIRVPSHPVALAVLREFGGGVAAPSANRFGAVSPTTAAHVIHDLADRLDPATDAVVDGGDSSVGVESTIIDCTGNAPRILRAGAISILDIERVTGSRVESADTRIKAPGTLASHYAPVAQVHVVDTEEELDLLVALLPMTKHIGVIALEKIQTPRGSIRLAMPRDCDDYAAVLYSALREADNLQLDHVVAIAPSGLGIAAAVRDRLTRAAHK